MKPKAETVTCIDQVADDHALSREERRLLHRYFRGGQTSAEFDALSEPLMAAVDAVTKRRRESLAQKLVDGLLDPVANSDGTVSATASYGPGFGQS